MDLGLKQSVSLLAGRLGWLVGLPFNDSMIGLLNVFDGR